MCKFSQEKYTRDAIIQTIEKLHGADEYPFEILGDHAGYAGSMMRQVKDGNRGMKDTNIIMLGRNLLDKDKNKRIANLMVPPGWSIARNEEVITNGCPNDEYIDGKEAISTFYNGHKTRNVDVMDEGIEQLEEVLQRMKAERARVAGRMS